MDRKISQKSLKKTKEFFVLVLIFFFKPCVVQSPGFNIQSKPVRMKRSQEYWILSYHLLKSCWEVINHFCSLLSANK